MKIIITITAVFLSVGAGAQELDTIKANEHHNVALFFPEKIRQAIVGAEDFVFSYNQEHPQFFGLLKASSGKASNLIAITHDGQVYSYVLSYSEQLPRLTYFLEKRSSVGNEKRDPTLVDSTSIKEKKVKQENDSLRSQRNLEQLAEHYLLTNSEAIEKKKKEGLVLQVNKIHHDEGRVFMVFEIENKSGIDFEPEYLRVYLSQGNRKKNASYQRLLQEPLLVYKFPKIIRHGQREKFVYVLPKFTLGERENLEVELREKKGSRVLKLRIAD